MLNCITYIQLHFFLYMLTYQNEGLSLAQRIAVLIAKLTGFFILWFKIKSNIQSGNKC